MMMKDGWMDDEKGARRRFMKKEKEKVFGLRTPIQNTIFG